MRKTRINLYSKEFHPKLIILGLKHMILLWIATILIMGVWANASIESKNAMVKKERIAREELEETEDELMQTQALVATLNVDPAIESKLAQTRKLFESKVRLSSFLLQNKNAKSHGFYGFMYGLASVPSDGVSVSRFMITDGKTDIEGVAVDGEVVPAWIDRFKDYPDLSDISFESVKFIYNRDDKYLGFVMQSKIRDEKDNKIDTQVK